MKMKLIWVLVAVVTINVTESESLKVTDLEKDIIVSDVSKTLNLSSYPMARRKNISLFPNRSHRKKDFVINFNPTMKYARPNFELGKYRKPFMKKLLIKDMHNEHNVKETAEVTTRRSLMQRKNYTVRPHDVYAKPIQKNNNWDNGNTSNYNFEKLKSEMKITSGKFQPSSEEETQNFNRGVMSNDHDFVDFEKQNINNATNEHDDIGLRKSKTLLLLPKRNNSNCSKVNTLRLRSENRTSSIVVHDQHSNVKIIEDKGNSTITPEVIIKPDSRIELDEIIEPIENISDQKKKDQEEHISVKDVNQRAVSNAKRDVSGNGAMTNEQRFRFYTFMKNKSS